MRGPGSGEISLRTLLQVALSRIAGWMWTGLWAVWALNPGMAQRKVTLSGYVREAASGEALLGASVYLKENLKGTTTNTYGFYSLTVEPGQYTVVVSYIGYRNFSQVVDLTRDLTLSVELQKVAVEAGAVEVTDERSRQNTESTRMGTVELQMEDVKKLPVLFGEVDILKTLTLLPGVQSSGEGNSGLYIRGGGPDQNLVLLDGAVVYNASHLFGFFSVFNSDAIKSVNLVKGGMPAQYGGRLSSVVDITMKEGNLKRWEVEGGLGAIASRLTVQGPLVKDKLAVIASGRRTYFDVLAKPFIPKKSPFRGSGYYFYDMNTKLHYRISEKDKLYLSGYFGRDVFSFVNREVGFRAAIVWGNATTTLRWNHQFNKKLFSNLMAVFTDYKFRFEGDQNNFRFKLFSGVRDYGLKADFNYYPVAGHDVRFGAEYLNHKFTPSNITFASQITDVKPPEPILYFSNEASAYASDDWDVTQRLRVNLGVRATFYAFNGRFIRYVKDALGATVDTIYYSRHQLIKPYFRAEPRLAARFKLNEWASVKASYTMNWQYIQLASRATISLPFDVWLPTTEYVVPQFSQQVAVGYYHNFWDDMLETSVELYYKPMRDLIEFQDGADPAQTLNSNIDNTLVQGKGKAWGAEFFIRKTRGKWNGWIGYTLAWTNRTFPQLNEGRTFWAKYDRRHDLSVVLSYDITSRLNVSAVFVYATGNTLTLPKNLYFIEERLVTEFAERNSYRFAPYHRLDLAATFVLTRPQKKFFSSLSLSIYNVYSRLNPFFIYYNSSGNLTEGTFKLQARQVSLFPIIPTITWNFKY
ncbi:MAG: TonB-dependent receptor [Flavobacteriales bacterium]|nr:TonB-dependent receptor [Flavobacteriales bacterium]MCX7767732.1 TonB-dependent receptor [Flavobacteriales bacterium]MDW8409373.1 TonB-dependent receptor [Flavobacteriales bacterium]